VHPEILGAEPHTEVPAYRFEIRRDVDDVWATNCRFFNARWVQAGDSVDMNRTYRVPSPFVVVLYRASRADPARRDVLAAFVHPLEETLCRAQLVTWLVDRTSLPTDLLVFEQAIFLQDRMIVENQRPLRLPLDVGLELPTRADGSSVAYRRWLKARGLRFGVTTDAAAALTETA
jgi:phenylpropionate dioxygenase-like ring-hydroxylating dioxygenase large terminal subunit